MVQRRPELSYSDETFATGVTDKNVALFPEAEVTGLISLGDGQPPQSVFILGVLRGNEASPYFTATSTGANFALDSLAPGVYDVTIFASNYIPVTISDVQVGALARRLVSLVNSSPVDPLVPLALSR